MPLKVTLHCGMQIMLPVETLQDLISRSIMGSIKLKLSNGHTFHLTKAEIAAAEEIPIAEVKAAAEKQKKAEEEQQKAEAVAAEEARKAREEKAQKEREATARWAAEVAAHNQAIEDAKLGNKIKRFLRIGPKRGQ